MNENDLVDTVRIEIGRTEKTRNLYESFYFRGNLKDSGHSFWLKHNLIGFVDAPDVRVDNTLILFDDEKQSTKVYHQSQNIEFGEFKKLHLDSNATWRKIRFDFGNQGFCQLDFSQDKVTLKGKIPDQGGAAEWDLKLGLSSMAYFHFDKEWFYRGFFPKKKILTADCFVEYDGKIKSPFLNCEGHFRGMNGHNWGKEHAFQYAYANCNEFLEEGKSIDEAFFDCFSAKILIGGFKSPYLSAGSLFYKGKWYDFNKVLSSWRHQVHDLSLKVYNVTFLSKEYQLDLLINGEGHAWITLDYDHPSRKVSQVHNTKHAKGTLKLTRLKDSAVIARLFTSSFELETLMPYDLMNLPDRRKT